MAQSKPKPKPSASKRSSGSAGSKSRPTRSSSSRAKSAPRKSAPKKRAPKKRPARTPATTASSNGRASGGGVTDTIKDVANKAKGPAVAVGAAAAGVAGGLVIRNRTRRKSVLGVPVPKHLPSVDPKGIAKTVGNASKQFAKTSKSVSKDIERAGDQAEKIGKILS